MALFQIKARHYRGTFACLEKRPDEMFYYADTLEEIVSSGVFYHPLWNIFPKDVSDLVCKLLEMRFKIAVAIADESSDLCKWTVFGAFVENRLRRIQDKIFRAAKHLRTLPVDELRNGQGFMKAMAFLMTTASDGPSDIIRIRDLSLSALRMLHEETTQDLEQKLALRHAQQSRSKEKAKQRPSKNPTAAKDIGPKPRESKTSPHIKIKKEQVFLSPSLYASS